MIKARKLVSIKSVTNTSRFFIFTFFIWNVPEHLIFTGVNIQLLSQNVIVAPTPPSISLSLALLGVFSLVLWWPYMGPFSGAQLFSEVLNSRANELPNKAHIGNSMSLAGLVVYNKMITAQQKAWKGDRGFNNHATYGPLVALNSDRKQAVVKLWTSLWDSAVSVHLHWEVLAAKYKQCNVQESHLKIQIISTAW